MRQVVWSSPSLARAIEVALLAVITVQGYFVSFGRTWHFRDFDVHREVGRRFLTGEPLYEDGLCYPYMPTAAMYFSPLALLDRHVGLALRYAVAVGCLLVTLALLERLLAHRLPQAPWQRRLISGAAVVLALQFILQDLDDGGPHLILLAILTAGLYAAWKGRSVSAACAIGFGIAVKVTPALFLPFFLWKRQYKLALFTTIAALTWIVLPALWMGSSSWLEHQVEWTQGVIRSLLDQRVGDEIINEERVRNQSLKHSLMRYLVAYPEGQSFRADDPGYMPILDLPMPAARAIVGIAALALILAVGWLSRRPFRVRDPEWARECSAVLILALLFSPITWVQHLVWLLPALFVVLTDVAKRGLTMLTASGLAAYALLAVILNYEVLGKTRFAQILSYHPFAIAMLILIALLVAGGRQSRTGGFNAAPSAWSQHGDRVA